MLIGEGKIFELIFKLSNKPRIIYKSLVTVLNKGLCILCRVISVTLLAFPLYSHDPLKYRFGLLNLKLSIQKKIPFDIHDMITPVEPVEPF